MSSSQVYLLTTKARRGIQFLSTHGYSAYSIRTALVWRDRASAEKCLEEGKKYFNCKSKFRASLMEEDVEEYGMNGYSLHSILVMSQEEYKKAVQGRFAVGDCVIKATFESIAQGTHPDSRPGKPEPLQVSVETVVRQSRNYVYITGEEEPFKKENASSNDTYEKHELWGSATQYQQLFANHEELEKEIESRRQSIQYTKPGVIYYPINLDALK